jgi:urease subunit alpha
VVPCESTFRRTLQHLDDQLTSEGGALDLVITNVTVVDAVLGVVKADVGVKDGLIAGVGKAGNSGTMDG